MKPYPISIICFSKFALVLASNAAVFPFIDDFEGNVPGTSQPAGWRQGPPVGTASIGDPWSVDELMDGRKVYKFSGPGEFDGNGRAYSTVEIADVPNEDGESWELSVDFQLAEFLTNGPTDSFRFGMGVLGSHFMFSNGRGGGFGGNDYYLVDWGFTLPEEVRQLDQIPMTYRILEFGPLGVVEIGFFSAHIQPGFFNTEDWFRMYVLGEYQGDSLTITSWVENLENANATDPVSSTIENPMSGRYFGPRFQSGSGVTTNSPPSFNTLGELTIYMDNFRVGEVGGLIQDPEPELPFWKDFEVSTDGWHVGWLGRLFPVEDTSWAKHEDFGWLYSKSTASNSVWFGVQEIDEIAWFWTAEEIFPHLMSDSENWYYLISEPTRMLYSQETSEFIILGE